jgi:hypothetical protein
VSLSGTKWESDYDANRSVYGQASGLPNGGDSKSVGALLTTSGDSAPADVRVFVESLRKNVGDGKEQ